VIDATALRVSHATHDLGPRVTPADDSLARTEAVAAALEREEPVLLAAARALTLDDAAARDLVQTTFELALRHAGQLREPRAMRAWLLTIQAREAFRLRRRLRRFVRLDSSVRELTVPDGAPAESLAVRDALRHLPARTRAAVVLHHMAGLSVNEVAEAMGTSPNTVKTQLRMGLATLREVLADA
jgi:RNA polymerase sigma-70 factor (ECF subfamily)